MRHVRENDPIALLEPFEHLNELDRRLAELDGRLHGFVSRFLARENRRAGGNELEQADLLIFLAEARTTQAASIISAAAGPGSGSSFAALAVAARTLCAVMIARSVVQGTPSLETQASLERFRPALTAALTD